MSIHEQETGINLALCLLSFNFFILSFHENFIHFFFLFFSLINILFSLTSNQIHPNLIIIIIIIIKLMGQLRRHEEGKETRIDPDHHLNVTVTSMDHTIQNALVDTRNASADQELVVGSVIGVILTFGVCTKYPKGILVAWVRPHLIHISFLFLFFFLFFSLPLPFSILIPFSVTQAKRIFSCRFCNP